MVAGRSWISGARRWSRLGWADRCLLVEALAALALLRLAIIALPFRRVVRIGAAHPRRPAPADPTATIAKMRWAIRAVSARVPFRAVCLEQGLAARAMLHRRGIPATLHFGARPGATGLAAHLWVRAGCHDVIGTENAGDYKLLSTVPPSPRS